MSQQQADSVWLSQEVSLPPQCVAGGLLAVLVAVPMVLAGASSGIATIVTLLFVVAFRALAFPSHGAPRASATVMVSSDRVVIRGCFGFSPWRQTREFRLEGMSVARHPDPLTITEDEVLVFSCRGAPVVSLRAVQLEPDTWKMLEAVISSAASGVGRLNVEAGRRRLGRIG